MLGMGAANYGLSQPVTPLTISVGPRLDLWLHPLVSSLAAQACRAGRPQIRQAAHAPHLAKAATQPKTPLAKIPDETTRLCRPAVP